MNVAKVGKAACKSRMVSKALAARQRRATVGVTGEDGRMIVRQLKTVLDIPVWKKSPKGSVDRARMVSPAVWVCSLRTRGRLASKRLAIRSTRDRAVHLKHHGFIQRTREPRFGRLAREAGQAAKPGDVPNEGRSSRSSPSAGKPRTWRRRAVDEYNLQAAGASHVCGIRC